MRLQGRETIPLCCDDSEAGLGSLRLVEMMCPAWLVGGFGEAETIDRYHRERGTTETDSITDWVSGALLWFLFSLMLCRHTSHGRQSIGHATNALIGCVLPWLLSLLSWWAVGTGLTAWWGQRCPPPGQSCKPHEARAQNDRS